MEYSKELEMMVKSLIKDEINGKYISSQFCDERFDRVYNKIVELESMKKQLDRLYGITVTAVIGIFSTFVAVLLKLVKF